MSKWIKIVNPPYIKDHKLVERWVSSFGSGITKNKTNNRLKIRHHNGDVIYKFKPKSYDFFIMMWKPLELPPVSLAFETSEFKDDDLLKDHVGKVSALLYDLEWDIVVSSMSSDELVEWFSKKFGDFGITEIKVVTDHYVSDDKLGILNIVTTKFIFTFDSEENMLFFKLSHG